MRTFSLEIPKCECISKEQKGSVLYGAVVNSMKSGQLKKQNNNYGALNSKRVYLDIFRKQGKKVVKKRNSYVKREILLNPIISFSICPLTNALRHFQIQFKKNFSAKKQMKPGSKIHAQ